MSAERDRRTRRLHAVANSDVAPSDEGLLAGVAARDDEATVAFVRRYQRRVFGLANSVLNDAGAAEDVAQEALLRVWRHAPVFDARRGSVETWVLTITKNLSIDALRKGRAVATDPEELTARARASSRPLPEDVASSHMTRTTITSALEALPVEQRRAVLLASLYGRTAVEIAELESVPLGTAKTRVRAGLLKLRDLLDREGGLR